MSILPIIVVATFTDKYNITVTVGHDVDYERESTKKVTRTE